MKFAYADPPYPGQAKRHYAKEAARDGRDAREVNHEILIGTLCAESDAWALSTSSSALASVLPLCPPVRVMAWVKPFCAWKQAFPPYAWEPVIVHGGRVSSLRSEAYKTFPRWNEPVRDWLSASTGPGHVPEGESVQGAKPFAFALWLFRVLGAMPSDDFWDVFPGSGNMQRAWRRYCGEFDTSSLPLFQEVAR